MSLCFMVDTFLFSLEANVNHYTSKANVLTHYFPKALKYLKQMSKRYTCFILCSWSIHSQIIRWALELIAQIVGIKRAHSEYEI